MPGSDCPAFVIELMQSCWHGDPVQRISAREIVSSFPKAAHLLGEGVESEVYGSSGRMRAKAAQ